MSIQACSLWNEIAPFWGETVGEGNAFHRLLVGPETERFPDVWRGQGVLEVACDNGNLTRRLAVLGARTVAFDFAEAFIARFGLRPNGPGNALGPGRACTPRHRKHRVMDTSDTEQFLALGRGQFDAAVCNMALMDMAAAHPYQNLEAGY